MAISLHIKISYITHKQCSTAQQQVEGGGPMASAAMRRMQDILKI